MHLFYEQKLKLQNLKKHNIGSLCSSARGYGSVWSGAVGAQRRAAAINSYEKTNQTSSCRPASQKQNNQLKQLRDGGGEADTVCESLAVGNNEMHFR